jgi:hypothetical protein
MVKSSDNKSYHKEATSVPTVEQLHITTAGSGGGDLPEDVKDLGRKARARLQEERDKRPEIVRLAVDPPEKGTAHKGIQFQVPNKPNKRAGEATAATSQKKRRRAFVAARPVADKDVDRWIPSVHHLPVCSRETRSTLVRLHGLPVGSTPEQIRRFLNGLDPQRVFVLPSNPVDLPAWDANHNNVRKRAGVRVERYAGDFRVYVKLASGPTAALAVGRSGEIISLLHDNEDISGDDGRNKGASIGVTQVPKTTANYIIRHMAIDAQPSIPMETTLVNVERKLDPEVSSILWTTAVRELNLEVAEGDDIFEGYPLLSKRFVGDRWLPAEELAHRRDTLEKARDRLLNQHPFPAGEVLDPALAADPVIFLTTGAVQCLQREIERMNDMVQDNIRRWRLFGRATRTSRDEVQHANLL